MTEEDQQSTDGSTSKDEGRPSGPPATPEERIAALEAEKVELRDRMLRIAAEFENWKKRSRREQTEAESKGREAVVRDMLEVIDNLERASAAATGGDPQGIQQGVQLVLRLFYSKLERYDVRPIEAKGTPFDPRMHDAISQVPTADVPPGTVISELQKGYKIGDRLLRPATVVVAIAPPATAGPNGEGRDRGQGDEGG
jgi:molecular chaperone GrpE